MSALRMSEEQWQAQCAKRSRWQTGPQTAQIEPPSTPAPAQPSKYRNVRTDGYASKKEATRALQLRLMQEAGQIRNVREQVPYLLTPPQYGADGKLLERGCTYLADFVYEEAPAWHPVVEDCKGMRTDMYVVKRKLMLFVHGITVRET